MPGRAIACVDLHTAGEPVRIVTGGFPDLPGRTLLEKRRVMRDQHDHLRRAVMLEPRGHAGMYGVIPLPAIHPEAAFSVLFMHNEGYSTMCGHATIALGRWAVEEGLVPAVAPETRFAIEAPCGLLRLTVAVENGRAGAVRFETVPAFAEALDLPLTAGAHRGVAVDLAYGGAYYAILPARRLGLDLFASPLADLTAAAAELTADLRRTHPIRHPAEPDLGFLYGTILTDDAGPDAESWNLCIFAEGQIDRSPTGSGVTARLALDAARGRMAPGQARIFRGVSGEPFSGRILRTETCHGRAAIVAEVGGTAHFAGRGSFLLADDDPFRHGFSLPQRLAAMRRT